MNAIDFYIEHIENFENMDFKQRREAVQLAKIESEKYHTKATLKGLFRMKPARDARSEKDYKSEFGGRVQLYRIDQCVAMRELSKKPRTKAQEEATKKLVQSNIENSPKGKAVELCKELINDSSIVIDTETTDLNGVAIQIALVCCATRKVLYSSLIATDKPISRGAFEVHGIDAEMLKDAPTAEQVKAEILPIIEDKNLVAFNSEFDSKVCARTFGKFDNKWTCAMYRVAVPTFGATNRHGTISLAYTVDCAGVQWSGAAHDAAADALATVDVIRKVAGV